MDRTYSKMVELTDGETIEISNYVYARFVFSEEEIKQLGDQGCNIVEEFSASINDLKNTIKEKYAVDISAEITGNKNNVVLVKGIGDLYDANVDEFVALLKLKRGIIDNYDIKTTEKAKAMAPAMKAPANVEKKEQVHPKTPRKEIKKNVKKPAQFKKPAKKPVKKVEKTFKKVEGKEVDFIDKIMKEDGLIMKDSLLQKMISEMGTNPMEARDVITAYIDQNDDVTEEDGWIYKES